MKIRLSPDEIDRCIKFSAESANNQQRIEFGEIKTKPRPSSEIARDNLIGKVAEVAVQKMLLKDYSLTIDLDFEVYSRGVWDETDFVVNGWRFDVKSTRIGRWLLLEEHKLVNWQNQGMLPHFFIACRTYWDESIGLPTGVVEIFGFFFINRIFKGNKNVLYLEENKCIPNTSAKLQTNNYAIKFNDLENVWGKLVMHIKSHTPPAINVNFI